VRKFAPMLLNAATAMGLAAKNETPDTSRRLSVTLAKEYGLGE
jgi:hypothetical protein